MLLQKTAIHAERFVFSFDDTDRSRIRGELISDAGMLESTHHELMGPDSSKRLGVDEKIRAIYEDTPWLLDSEMRNYLLHIRSLADGEADELTFGNPHLVYVRNPETVDKIGNGLDTIVDVYEARGNAKMHQLNVLAIWSFASTLVLLLLDGAFVFRPMVHKVREDVVELSNLNTTLEVRVAERTAEVERRATQLAESEAALRESEALYSSLVHHMPMAVLRKEKDGRFTFAKQRFCEMLGKPMSEIIGRTDADFYTPAMAAKYRADDLRVMDQGAVFQDIEQHQNRHASELFVEVLKVPLRDANDSVVGTQAMFWDVTDRAQAEQRALQAERLAAIGQVVTGVAHESRNALQQIQACSQLLKWELEGDEKRLELINDLQRAEERLLRTFEELRSYAAPLKLDRRPCDIRSIVEQAWSATAPQRAGRNVSLVEDSAHVCTDCVADSLRLEQVFRNLFENALSASHDPVRIEVEYEEIKSSDQRSTMQITVKDNGPGLSPEQQTRIFEPFFTTKTEGTGLGMAIVKRIVDAHRGKISVEEHGMQGAAIIIMLPRGESRHDIFQVKHNS